MTYRWIQRPIDDPADVASLQQALNDLPEALARTLVARGITTFDAARDFFRADRSDLHDPFMMADMRRAAERLADAITQGATVMVYGDYDVDGTTATTVMTHFLRTHGADVSYFIPDRYRDGYGLCRRGMDVAAARGAELVVALDCGITAHDEAAYARELGLDLIICDHHTPKDTLPPATAVLDPKRPDCDYPFAELCGCGVGVKLVQATLDVLGRAPDAAFQYLDLLAVATASDIVPLRDENRVLMAEGLDALQRSQRIGLNALADAADLSLSSVTSTGRIVFTIGPRINAAGRMEDAEQAVALLLADDPDAAASRAQHIEQLNTKRRDINDEILREAVAQAERRITAATPHALVLYDPDWHLGIIGIVASSIVERYHKPTIMLTRNGDTVKGSARSIRGINIYDALSECEDTLIQFGGHDYAAGMSLEPTQIEAFREQFNAAVGRRITPELLTPSLRVDAALDLEAIGRVQDRFWSVLKQFGPFGPSNPTPVFQARSVALARPPRTVGSDDKHLKLSVRPAEARAPTYDVIGFGMGAKQRALQQCWDDGTPIELLFSVEENTWNGRTSLQLKARDVRPLAQGEPAES
ncbi:single-stranded-DNA-specific exonuclease RecJ [Salisaeta longa]|uniref:single-stranded-DNA-specific exonuclease RecJ n=1 Tax=Salisaeta longa TaxID=503170 RepID=UPI0003B400F2|nr:single-stranded-DNA-specific exonuclease RecJ [Salisaeta longa]